MSFIPPVVPVGWNVHYFRDENPCAALVTYTPNSGSMIHLTCWDAHGNQIPHQGVCHKNDPRLETNPTLRAQGWWDFIPGHVYSQLAREEEAPSETFEEKTERKLAARPKRKPGRPRKTPVTADTF